MPATSGGTTNRDWTEAGQRLIEVPRYRPDRVTGVEMALDRRTHDAQRLARERLRAGAELEVREQRLFGLVHRQHRGRDRNVLGRAGGAARLRVEQRRFRGQRLGARAPLVVDVGTQHLVVLHRHPVTKLRRVGNSVEAVLDAEARVPIGREERPQHLLLRGIRLARHAFDRPPVTDPVERHRLRAATDRCMSF